MSKSKHRLKLKKISVPVVGKCLICGELTTKTELFSHQERKYSYHLCGKHPRNEELLQSIKDTFEYVNEE